jgi:hypothetical protein
VPAPLLQEGLQFGDSLQIFAPPGFAQFLSVSSEAFELVKSLIDGQLEIFSKECAIYVFFISLDDWVGIIRRREIIEIMRIGHIAHMIGFYYGENWLT